MIQVIFKHELTKEKKAPASIRGLCTCVFTGFVYLGIVLAYFANYGCELNLGDTTHNRWVCLIYPEPLISPILTPK